jgi:SpoVK/Ycf46/Vps4 family AAA+-type ATPase
LFEEYSFLNFNTSAVKYKKSFTNLDSAQGIVRIFNDHSNAWYMLIYSVMVIGFTFLYTALIFNPKQISEDLKLNEIARITENFNGAQLKAICIEAGMNAIRSCRKIIFHDDFIQALNSIQLKTKTIMDYFG